MAIYMKSRLAGGFTLIEALVALLVVAVAYAGVITALSRFADQRWMIEKRNFAHRLAWNQLVDSYLRNMGAIQSGKTKSDDKGSIEFHSTNWQWQRNDQRTAEGSLTRYQVDVSIDNEKQGRPVWSLVIFLPSR